MPSFTLNGITYGFLSPDPGDLEGTQSWEYGKWPKVTATLALQGGGTLKVFARAERWKHSHILARWEDDDYRPHYAWIPANSIHRVTDSEWDIGDYGRCPENLRAARWRHRLPGFLPAES